MQQRITLGILAQEFMDDRVGGKGGFGWAALNVARLFRDSPDLGVDVVFLAAKRRPGGFEAQELHGIPVVFRQEPRALQRAVRAHGVDLILTIDYRPAYHTFLEACPRLPLIVWSRDPRSSADVAKVNTLRLPDGSAPRGIDPVDCTGLRREV